MATVGGGGSAKQPTMKFSLPSSAALAKNAGMNKPKPGGLSGDASISKGTMKATNRSVGKVPATRSTTRSMSAAPSVQKATRKAQNSVVKPVQISAPPPPSGSTRFSGTTPRVRKTGLRSPKRL